MWHRPCDQCGRFVLLIVSSSSLQKNQKKDFILTNSVDVFLDTTMIHARQVIVDDMRNISHINTTSSDASGDEKGSLSTAECSHRVLSLSLGTISMHRGGRQLMVKEVVIDLISHALAVDKDDRSTRLHAIDEIEEGLLLELRLHPNDVLSDVLVRTANTTDANANVCLGQMGFRELSDCDREGC